MCGSCWMAWVKKVGSVLAVALVVGLAVGCATIMAPAGTGSDAPDLAAGIEKLGAPLPGDLSALYRMRVASTGGLRLTVVERGAAGRLVVSRPLGGAVALASWNGAEARLFDLEHGCEDDTARAAGIVGLGVLPLRQVPRILGGRLPEGQVDVEDSDRREVLVRGGGWSCRAVLGAEPWRVLSLELPDGTRAELSHHTSSVPGMVKVLNPAGDWVQLELTRLEWDSPAGLPPLPKLDVCPPPTH
jgi:hypothetical protein